MLPFHSGCQRSFSFGGGEIQSVESSLLTNRTQVHSIDLFVTLTSTPGTLAAEIRVLCSTPPIIATLSRPERVLLAGEELSVYLADKEEVGSALYSWRDNQKMCRVSEKREKPSIDR
jgi:hypothetical protein